MIKKILGIVAGILTIYLSIVTVDFVLELRANRKERRTQIGADGKPVIAIDELQDGIIEAIAKHGFGIHDEKWIAANIRHIEFERTKMRFYERGGLLFTLDYRSRARASQAHIVARAIMRQVAPSEERLKGILDSREVLTYTLGEDGWRKNLI